jgi:acetyl esterase/lipase
MIENTSAAPLGQVITGLRYAELVSPDSQAHLLDLYLPAQAARPTALVIWSCGSAFLGDNGREGAEIAAAALNPLGFAVAGVSVRASWQARFPGSLHDIKAAIRFLRANAAAYHLDPDHFASMGDSSGGWTAAMAAVTGGLPEWEGTVGISGPSSAVQAGVSFYPPTDFLQMDAHMLDGGRFFSAAFHLQAGHADPASPESLLIGGPIGDHPDRVRQANPAAYANPAVPPMLILHGQRDELVPHHQGELLYAALVSAAVEAHFISLPLAGHGGWESFLSDPAVSQGAQIYTSRSSAPHSGRLVQLSWSTVLGFLQRHLHGLQL